MGKSGKFSTLKEIDVIVDNYIKNCVSNNKAPTHPRLAQELKFHCQDDMKAWFRHNKRFAASLSRASDLIEDHWAQLLADRTNKNGNGAYRYLQAKFNYTDKIDLSKFETTKVIRLPAKKVVGATLGNITNPKLRNKTQLSRNTKKGII